MTSSELDRLGELLRRATLVLLVLAAVMPMSLWPLVLGAAACCALAEGVAALLDHRVRRRPGGASTNSR